MSNIQITENESGKYSPEWFYTESQTPEWIAFAHKADELRENFINLFGIERLKSLSGRNLLTSLFYNDEGNKTNLCYMLEMDKDIREVFGGISGGSAYKFGLFYHKKNQSWTCGSPLRPIHLTEEEAIQKAEEIRNDLIEGAEIISSFGPLNSEEDYEQLYKQLGHISGINMVWRMKYYQILFPTLFAPFYGQDIQLRVLHFLNQKPSDIPFIRMGQISLYVRKCNVPGVVLPIFMERMWDIPMTLMILTQILFPIKSIKFTTGCIQFLTIIAGLNVSKKKSWFLVWMTSAIIPNTLLKKLFVKN